MKYTSFLLIPLLLLFWTSCNKDETSLPELCPDCEFTCFTDTDTDIITNDCDDNQTCSFKIHTDAALQLPDRAAMTWKAGNKLVFLFNVYTDPDPNVADEESTILLGFEVPADQTSFSLEGNQLSNINLHSQRLCFCAGIPTNKIEKGCIQGKQQTDGSWWVQGNLVIKLWQDNEVDYKFEVKFEE